VCHLTRSERELGDTPPQLARHSAATTGATPAALPPGPPPAATLARPRIKRATWPRGVLCITLRGALPKGARLHAKVTFARRKAMFLRSARSTLQTRTPLPRRVQLHLTAPGASSAIVTIKVTRLKR
jgi:hypothetical protein